MMLDCPIQSHLDIEGNVTGNLTGTADLARNLTGTPHVQVGVITATDVHTTNLDVTGIGTVRTLNATLQGFKLVVVIIVFLPNQQVDLELVQ